MAAPYVISSANDLGNAVSSTNALGAPAAFQFNSSSIDLATLSSPPLGSLQFDTIFQDGTGTNALTITHSAIGVTTVFGSTAFLSITPNYSVNFLGAGSFGQDGSGNGLSGNGSALSAGSLGLSVGSLLNVEAGNGSDSSSGATVVGGGGGSASLSVTGSVLMDSSSISLTGGNTGSGNGAFGVTEAQGGNATATLGSLTITSTSYLDNPGSGVLSSFTLTGGKGGLGGDYASGGEGGSAVMNVAGAMLVESANVTVMGGAGGEALSAFTGTAFGNGGNGGDAVVTASGPMSVSSGNMVVQGGIGGAGQNGANGVYGDNGGNGGSAMVSIVSDFTLVASNGSASLKVTGGEGGPADTGYCFSTGGYGGGAELNLGGAVSVDSAVVNLTGGNGNAGNGNSGQTEGLGGSASALLGSLMLTSQSFFSNTSTGAQTSFTLTAGAGGTEFNNGNGGFGGGADLIVGGPLSVDSSLVNVTAGAGGLFDGFANGGVGGNSGNGGGVLVFVGSDLTLTASLGSWSFGVQGGNGGNNFQAVGAPGEGGIGGVGGNATLNVSGAMVMDSGQVTVGGGNAGQGDGAAGETQSAGGIAKVLLGALTVTSNDFYANGKGGSSGLLVLGGTGGADQGEGNGFAGEDADLTVFGGGVVDSSSVSLEGGAGGNSQSANSGNGGNAFVSIGLNLSLTADLGRSGLGLYAGNAGDNLGTGQGSSGAGGSTNLTVGGVLSLDSAQAALKGGNGGYGTGPSGPGFYEGWGGNAVAVLGSLTMTSNSFYGNGIDAPSILLLAAGVGGTDEGLSGGGNGGVAVLTVSGPAFVDSSSISLVGGSGGNSQASFGGNGGNAVAGLGSNLTLSADLGFSSLVLSGGNGGSNLGSAPGIGGSGGFVGWSGSEVSVDSSQALITGGNAGFGNGANDVTEASGGSAGVSFGSLTLTSNSYVGIGKGVSCLLGITAGAGSTDDGLGNGGAGGNSVFTVFGGVSLDASGISLSGGSGGNSANRLGGRGGLAELVAASAALNQNSSITLLGGNGGNGATEGNGGSAIVSIGSLNLVDSGSGLYVAGGSGLVAGNASVTMDSLFGTGSLQISGPGTNTLQVSSGQFSGILSGNEALVKTGIGTLLLSGADIYTGGTQLNSGFLAVGNSSALGTGSVSVNGGTLGTDGVNHTINIAGNYTQASVGTLQLGLAGAVTGQWDILNVGGSAQVAGTLLLVPQNGFYFRRGETFELADATGGIAGEFGSVLDEVSGLPVSVVYQPNEILLEVLTPVYGQLGLTFNEKAVGSALDALGQASPNSSLVALMDYYSSNPTVTTANLDALSPAGLTALCRMGFGLAQDQAQIVERHLAGFWGNPEGTSNGSSGKGPGPLFAGNLPAAQEASMASGLQPNRWNVFLEGLGNFATVSGDGNAAGYQFSIGGTTAGMDYLFAKDLVGGLLLGYSQSGTSQSSSQVQATGGQAGFYVGLRKNDLQLETLVAAGLNSYGTQRAGLGGTAVGNGQGFQYTAQVSGAQESLLDQAVLRPSLSLQWTQVNLNGFNESGSAAPLSYGAQGEGSLTSRFGATASRNWDWAGLVLSPSLSVDWQHLWAGNMDSLSAGFAGQGNGAGFTVDGPVMGTDAMVLGAALDTRFAKGLSLYLGYQGMLGLTRYDSQDVQGGVNFGF